jgi:hypothetical protein
MERDRNFNEYSWRNVSLGNMKTPRPNRASQSDFK